LDVVKLARRIWHIAGAVALPMAGVGAIAAVYGHRWGAWLLIASVVLAVGGHLLASVLGYREVLSHEWPKVRPLNDWDD
jgi:hypothetical protein